MRIILQSIGAGALGVCAIARQSLPSRYLLRGAEENCVPGGTTVGPCPSHDTADAWFFTNGDSEKNDAIACLYAHNVDDFTMQDCEKENTFFQFDIPCSNWEDVEEACLSGTIQHNFTISTIDPTDDAEDKDGFPWVLFTTIVTSIFGVLVAGGILFTVIRCAREDLAKYYSLPADRRTQELYLPIRNNDSDNLDRNDIFNFEDIPVSSERGSSVSSNSSTRTDITDFIHVTVVRHAHK